MANRIFLHFLDREVSFISRSIQRHVVGDFLSVFKVCALHSYETMVLSGGHLFEHPAALEIFRRYPDLFFREQIVPIAQARSLYEFVDIKADQYQHTAGSTRRNYDIYFGSEWQEVFIGPVFFEAPNADTTLLLASAVLNEFSQNEDQAKKVIERINERGRRAITSELFHDISEEIGRQYFLNLQLSISRNYQKIYREQYAPYIFVGTHLVNPHLEARIGREYSFPIASHLSTNLNLGRIFYDPRFRFADLRQSIEHVRYVDVTRRLFSAASLTEIPLISRILGRVVPEKFVGRGAIADIDNQLRIVADSLGQFDDLELKDVASEISKEYKTAYRPADNIKVEYKRMQDPSSRAASGRPRVFLVIAAQKELNYARQYLRKNEFSLSEEVELGDNKIGHVFYVERQVSGTSISMPVGLVRANQKGKAEMRALVQAIDQYEDPVVVIMIGMMAGLREKSRIFDVIAPRTVYDATTVSTADGRIYVEPQPTYMDPTLHNRISNLEWAETPESYIKIITEKVTVTVPGTFDSLTNEIAQQAITRDPENTVGLEMEASALSEMQRDQGQVGRRVHYLMVKGVADYAGHLIPQEEIEWLRGVGRVSQILPREVVGEFDPRADDEVKSAFQREATERSLQVALRLLKTFPRLG